MTMSLSLVQWWIYYRPSEKEIIETKDWFDIHVYLSCSPQLALCWHLSFVRITAFILFIPSVPALTSRCRPWHKIKFAMQKLIIMAALSRLMKVIRTQLGSFLAQCKLHSIHCIEINSHIAAGASTHNFTSTSCLQSSEGINLLSAHLLSHLLTWPAYDNSINKHCYIWG